jgi:hypothetical protein
MAPKAIAISVRRPSRRKPHQAVADATTMAVSQSVFTIRPGKRVISVSLARKRLSILIKIGKSS